MVKNKKRHYFYLFSAGTGIVLFLLQRHLFMLSFIPLWVPVVLAAAATIAATFINRRGFTGTYQLRRPLLRGIGILYSLISWGFIIGSLFVMTNYYYPKKGVVRKEVPILSRSSHPLHQGENAPEQPVFRIDYKGHERDLVFAPRFSRWFEDYGSVILTIQEGFWGYEIIIGRALVK